MRLEYLNRQEGYLLNSLYFSSIAAEVAEVFSVDGILRSLVLKELERQTVKRLS